MTAIPLDIRTAATTLACALAGATPLRSQAAVRVDLLGTTRYVWHGISRAGFADIQPSLALGYRFGRSLLVEGGAVMHEELGARAASDLTEAGVGKHLGEVDTWGEIALGESALRLHVGAIHYHFEGDSLAGGIGPSQSTTEVYAALGLSSRTVTTRVELWEDVARVQGVWLHASAKTPALAWPFQPFIFLHFESDVGLNLGQQPNGADSTQGSNYASAGVTHVGVGLSLSLRPVVWRGVGAMTLSMGGRGQLNLDDATKVNRGGPPRDVIGWFWVGTTLMVGGDARTIR